MDRQLFAYDSLKGGSWGMASAVEGIFTVYEIGDAFFFQKKPCMGEAEF